MNKVDYVNKMNAILSDETKFCKMVKEKDKTHLIEKIISKVLRTMKQDGYIDAHTFSRIHPTGCTIPRLYGLPKVHKPGLPLRPILDMFNSPYHSLAKWLVEVLEPIRKELTIHSLKDTFQFVDRINDLQLNEHYMFSLDVESLFRNVPLRETVDYICDYIDHTGREIGIPTTLLKRLILLCTENIQFQFNNGIYRQKDGVAMGSPIGPLLANIFMSKLETQKLSLVINKLTCYCRYVNDIFVIAKNTMDLNEVLNLFNSVHVNTKFSVEREADGHLSFLDVNVIKRTDGTLKREIFRKPIWTGQYLHFDSFVPLRQKRNLVRFLTERAIKICSTDTVEKELDFLKQIFDQNGYPSRFIVKTMERGKPMTKSVSVPKKRVYISLPFKGEVLAELITRRLRNATENTYMASTLSLSFSSRVFIKSHLKDKLPQSTASYCVYHFECSCRASYVGRTTRRLSDRIREHCPASLTRGLPTSNASSIALHIAETAHVTNASQAFKIVYRVPRNRSQPIRFRLLSIAEAIAIRLLNPELCIQKKFVRSLNLCWPSVNPLSQI